MVSIDGVIAHCKRNLARDPLATRLTLAALTARLFQENGWQSVIVGGTAVDTYVSGALGTSEAYPAGWDESFDIDTIVMRALSPVTTSDAVDLLEKHGFRPSPLRSGVQHPELAIIIDFVGWGLPEDYSPDHIYSIHILDWEELGIGPAHLAGPEDILFDYMESGWHMHHQRDWARALAVTAVMEEGLDLGYLFTKAHWRMDGTYVGPLERLLRGEPLASRSRL